ncbi:5074_t:CDS:2, partial [Paraglomus occultum]
ELLTYSGKINGSGRLVRPCNAPQLYAREFARRQRPGNRTRIVGRAMAAWKTLLPSEKRVFNLAAEIVRARFKAKYPNYTYEPQPAKKPTPKKCCAERALYYWKK